MKIDSASAPRAPSLSPAPTQGVFAALWLPTDASGQLLQAELAENLSFLRQHGVHGVLALGSTGEFPHFDLEQRKQALALVAELADPLPVIANVSDIRPQVVAELGRFAREIGLPAITIMPPGFFPSSQDDLLAHFLHAAESSGLPTFLYNFPELTGTRIGLETVAAFAEQANMVGIKQSGGEFAYHRELIQLGREKDFVVFSGADTRLPEVFGLGATGCIGGLVNIVPELMVHLYEVSRTDKAGDIQPAFDRLAEVGAVLDRLTFPLNVAAGLEARGLHPGAPKAVVSSGSQRLYGEIVDELSRLFAEWELPLGAAAAPSTS
ncbi:dihydrodipicolinate synthase family protein [Synoicihabitans lomoniglobus]|uniref:Dihydrodipicolinate synthase family protein n=1 Tax=Synoicihabitans lomoniglobus TaxID=2909285 RepID=A0AAE9ZSK6_9BACT|nr:dihydrodipicolinate synthase family protein [Opitutaceae bacterium LMO-M01]WED63402.1 dihydrodipicolinate synthase family protein [Opitutaceae bacterium LMO-M01]